MSWFCRIWRAGSSPARSAFAVVERAAMNCSGGKRPGYLEGGMTRNYWKQHRWAPGAREPANRASPKPCVCSQGLQSHLPPHGAHPDRGRGQIVLQQKQAAPGTGRCSGRAFAGEGGDQGRGGRRPGGCPPSLTLYGSLIRPAGIMTMPLTIALSTGGWGGQGG